ncbi:hypothetical protein O1611_g2842 [Lasiodiplodia mahajangana]|uniref:Uncharacterized protein n=1 Tax=Lasiodiplodia mahajangana TaxID=1108764 RepID=A0ACC2JTE8_9PEZI|nr:hypothetical protein O1611_g2842 [Lasiodiplodia mahajangana]
MAPRGFPRAPADVANIHSKGALNHPFRKDKRNRRKRAARTEDVKAANEQHSQLAENVERESGDEQDSPEHREVAKEDGNNEESLDKIKLEALKEKATELQGYFNQLQDAVTIGMLQAQRLKEEIAVATHALDLVKK